MSSILTNNSAMVALQTLKGINKNLSGVQSEISTGKSVASAKDNSAVWAISKVMESDVNGFKAISDSLALGESTVAVARNAAESITDLLTEMKGKIVAAQEDNVDRAKINDDVTALRNQIDSVVSAAQFNGLNLVDGSTASADILSSLDRDSTGNVSSSSITVTAQDLSTGGYTAISGFEGTNTDGVAADNRDTFGFSLDANGGTDDSGQIEFDTLANAGYSAGDSVSLRLGETEVTYTITQADIDATSTNDVIALGVKSAIEASDADVSVDYDAANSGRLVVTNEDGTDGLSVSGQFTNAGSGGLGALSAIDVSSGAGATAALGSIESLIDTSITAASAFGSVEGRINTQSEFISSLTDSLKSGIGAMVDADMEEASARLQALQVQQQLGTQSLSIANQSPQALLSLFR
ncbi:flagellin [Aquicoccus sp.]|uniref:flagellin N-terminal helical domain-containing protein n=1 Tax=Aquicoccus sp. TaxID=2055851 RepID=UPI00356AADBD